MAPPVIWTFEPSVLVGVAAISLAYVCGWLRARTPGQPHPPGLDKLALFALSMVCVLVALVSPVDSWSTDFLFVHMIQHLLLLDLMPIALILSLTKGILRPVTRKVTVIERNIGPLGHPAFALCAYISMMIVWHIPPLYDTALAHPLLHVLEHLCFSTAGFMYWWHLLSPIKARQHLAGMGPVAYMVITKLTVGVLGVLLAFSPHSFYPWYEHHIHYLHLSPTVDQNIAGLVMALEQSIVMGIAVGYFFVRALNESEAKAQREERFAGAEAGAVTVGAGRAVAGNGHRPEAVPARAVRADRAARVQRGEPVTLGPAGLPLAHVATPNPPAPSPPEPAPPEPASKPPTPAREPLVEVADQQALDRQLAR
jgi:putative membrane protein